VLLYACLGISGGCQSIEAGCTWWFLRVRTGKLAESFLGDCGEVALTWSMCNSNESKQKRATTMKEGTR
jgi:hypothetical protein